MMTSIKKYIQLSRTELFLLPLILFIFFVNAHYFDFYNNSYKKSIHYYKGLSIPDRYDRIQHEHPYYELYKLAKEYNAPTDKIIFIYQDRKPEHLDYTSTFYSNLNNPNPETPITEYLTELGMYMNYIFYPRVIEPIDLGRFELTELDENTLVVADIDILSTEYAGLLNTSKLEMVERRVKEPLRVNRHIENPYYMYRVVSR